MAPSNVPTLRIRCPQCRTVMRVAVHASPTCSQCGYAGRSKGPAFPLETAPAAAAAYDAPHGTWHDTPEATTPEAAWAPATGDEGEWAAAEPAWEGSEQGWSDPAAAPADAGWQEAPAEAPEAWPEAPEPAPAPKKKAIFRRT